MPVSHPRSKAEQQRDTGFDPARNIVSNPLTHPERDAGPGAFVIAADSIAHPVAELFNHVYSTLLMLLTQFYDPVGENPSQREMIQAAARRAISATIRPLAEVWKHFVDLIELYGQL
jgi:hypothetical protein